MDTLLNLNFLIRLNVYYLVASNAIVQHAVFFQPTLVQIALRILVFRLVHNSFVVETP